MYDVVFFTNQPSFYKINLYNKIANQQKVFVIFLGESSIERTKDFFKGEMKFEYLFLNRGVYEKRNRIISYLKLLKLLFKLKYRFIITMGWSTIEDFLIVTFSKKSKNGLVCETSIYETNLKGWKRYLKKYIINRVSYAFVSGKPQRDIFKELNFKGKILITGGVGLYNRNTKFIKRTEKKKYSYLCVARLSEEKNLEFLINVFNKNGKELAIAGQGPLEEKLKKLSRDNIKFLGHIPNDKINNIYKKYDIFILPSKIEPWGLVVEEAISNYMPVIVSSKVGCNIDIVKELESGEIFEYNDEDDLNKKIEKIEKNYFKYFIKIKSLNLKNRDINQINVYINKEELKNE